MKTQLLILLILIPLQIFSNAAQPGFWDAGGTGTFSLLYPEDSARYKKIQMVKEKISIQLYKGFAVVKGEYWMFNETDSIIRIKVGYPVNSDYERRNNQDFRMVQIRFDSLYNLKAFVNGRIVEFIDKPLQDNEINRKKNNWYVWENEFPAKDTSKIEVYFIVNTNKTWIRQGYVVDKNNGFIYLLETGATWKQPILEGEIRIQLMDNILLEDIGGVSPDSIFMVSANSKILKWNFKNLSPTPRENIIIAYTKNLDNFNFADILARKDALYSELDIFSNMEIQQSSLANWKFGNPFETRSINWMMWSMIIIFVGLPLIIAIIIVVLLVRSRRRKKKLL